MVKNLPTERETRVRSLGQEDLLRKGIATHPSVLAWRTPWTEEPDGLQSMGSQRVRHDLATEQAKVSWALEQRRDQGHGRWERGYRTTSALIWRLPRAEEESHCCPWELTLGRGGLCR